MTDRRIQVTPSGCWEFTGYRNPQGYGQRKWRGRLWLVHRLAWVLANGPIPDGLCVLHRCDNPPCCNPAHMFLGTNADNTADMVAKGRTGSRVGAVNGHAKLTEAQVREIRARCAAGENRVAVAAVYGINRSHVWHITSGRSWAHVR